MIMSTTNRARLGLGAALACSAALLASAVFIGWVINELASDNRAMRRERLADEEVIRRLSAELASARLNSAAPEPAVSRSDWSAPSSQTPQKPAPVPAWLPGVVPYLGPGYSPDKTVSRVISTGPR